jgi:hypothetical protein
MILRASEILSGVILIAAIPSNIISFIPCEARFLPAKSSSGASIGEPALRIVYKAS